MLTVEQISTCQRIGGASIRLAEFDELCATAKAGVTLAGMLRGFIGQAERDGEGEQPDIKALRRFLKIAGFEP